MASKCEKISQFNLKQQFLRLLSFSLTHSDDLDPDALQPVSRCHGVVLGLPVRQQDEEEGDVPPGAGRRLHVLLHDVKQRLACRVEAPTSSVMGLFGAMRRSTSRGLCVRFTCEGVSSLVSEVPHRLQQLLFAGEVVELPLGARVPAVLAQTCGPSSNTHTTTYMGNKKNLPECMSLKIR